METNFFYQEAKESASENLQQARKATTNRFIVALDYVSKKTITTKDYAVEIMKQVENAVDVKGVAIMYGVVDS